MKETIYGDETCLSYGMRQTVNKPNSTHSFKWDSKLFKLRNVSFHNYLLQLKAAPMTLICFIALKKAKDIRTHY